MIVEREPEVAFPRVAGIRADLLRKSQQSFTRQE
jgi:hypothetical protein